MTKTDKILFEAVAGLFRTYCEWTITTSMHKSREDAIACSLLGLMGETFEYYYKIDHEPDTDPEQFRAELGDVLYYLAHLSYRLGIVNDLKILDLEHNEILSFESAGSTVVAQLQEQFKKVIREYSYDLDASGRRERVVEIVNTLLTMLYDEAMDNGWDFLEILEENQKKLSSRKERGVIGGDGDVR